MRAQRTSWQMWMVGGSAIVVLLVAGIVIVARFSAAPQQPGLATQQGSPPASAQQPAGPAVPKPVAEIVPGLVGRIAPVHLSWQASGSSGLLGEIDGCIPCGPGVDALWQRGNLFLMRERGRAELVWAAEGVGDYFVARDTGATPVCFDGRYVWAGLCRLGHTPLLVAVDPASGKSWTAGPQDGLPLAPGDVGRGNEPFVVVGPIGPGKACVATFSTEMRLAVAQLDPEHGVSIKALASPEPPVPRGRDISGRPLMAPRPANAAKQPARPVALFNLATPEATDAASQRRIVIAHDDRGAGGSGAPALIDPDSLEVGFASDNGIVNPINGFRLGQAAGSFYWLDKPGDQNAEILLVRAALPTLEQEVALVGMPEGKPVAYGDGLAFLGEKCWLWKPGERQVRTVDVQPPWTFQSALKIERPSLQMPAGEKHAGEQWELQQVFASQHYGVLARARKLIGPNSYAGVHLLFQFALASDPRAAPEPPPAPQKRQLAIDLPPGAAASELRLFAANAEAAVPRAELLKSVEAKVDDQHRFPVLAREIVRQALLIAARDQLQWATRDEVLGEAMTADAEPAARFIISTRFPYAGAASFELQRIGADGKPNSVWREEVVLNSKDDEPLDYARLTQAAERWSREVFPASLAQGGLSGKPRASSAAAAPNAAVESLRQMALTAQFAAVRELHHALEQGDSDELVGALVRGYGNLGVLSEFHWNAAHKGFKARSLVYAERLAARKPQSAEALWRRAYARSLAGLHDSAVADIDEAGKKAAGEKTAQPGWLQVIDAYSRFDTHKLAGYAEQGDEAALASLLHFFHWETLKESTAVQTLARGIVERHPDDFRLLDALCDSCELSTLHAVTQLAPAVLAQSAPLRLRQITGLPSATTELLARPASNVASVTELAESLLAKPAQRDGAEFTWPILGRMLQETEFIQLWRRAYFMRFQWAVPTDDFLAAVADVARGHHYRPLIDALSSDLTRQTAATETLAAQLQLDDLDYAPRNALMQAMGALWQARWPELYVEAGQRPALHIDDIHRDLLTRMADEQWRASQNLMARLNKVSSRSPDAIAAQIRQNRSPPTGLSALEQKYSERFGDTPQFWKALAERAMSHDDRIRACRRYIELSPDTWAYRMLAGSLRDQGKVDEWKATLDECLKQPAFGLEHAQVRVQIANDLMDRGEWQQAQPYAEEAAETWAEWAMLCAIRCYQGMRDDRQEGVWRARIVERYEKLVEWLDYYAWSRRSGLGDSAAILKTLEPMVAAAAQNARSDLQYQLGLYYQLSRQPRKALAIYQSGGSGQDERRVCFDRLWTAALAQELNDAPTRDAALGRIAETRDPSLAPFAKLAVWIKTLAGDGGQKPNLAMPREIAAAAGASDRPTLNAMAGRFLDLFGHKDDAVAFYREAVAAPESRFSATCMLVCALLRDRQLDPYEGEGSGAK